MHGPLLKMNSMKYNSILDIKMSSLNGILDRKFTNITITNLEVFTGA